VVATGTGGRKKEAEVQCAIDACTKLDGKGLLRAENGGAISAVVAAERKRRMTELFGDANDHSDDDEFYDRAGTGLPPSPLPNP
jgi:hypothetical protein